MSDKKPKFDIVDDIASADFVFDAYGETMGGLFAACATACFHAMTDIEQVEPTKEYSFTNEADSPEELLYDFISELIFLKDAEKTFFSTFEVEVGNDGKSLRAVVAGEAIDHTKHAIKTDVKAVTYHGLEIKKWGNGYKTRMILDL